MNCRKECPALTPAASTSAWCKCEHCRHLPLDDNEEILLWQVCVSGRQQRPRVPTLSVSIALTIPVCGTLTPLGTPVDPGRGWYEVAKPLHEMKHVLPPCCI